MESFHQMAIIVHGYKDQFCILQASIQNQPPTLKKGLTGWKWFEEGVVHYNEDNDNYSIITLPNGRKGLMYGSPKLNVGEVAAGWLVFLSRKWSRLYKFKNPDQAWGLPTPCNQKTNLNFFFGIQISVAEDIANCSTEKVDVGLFVMADSETGCLHPATCEGAEPIRFSEHLIVVILYRLHFRK